MQTLALPNGTRKQIALSDRATAVGQYIKSQFSSAVYVVCGNNGNRPNALTIVYAGTLVGGA